jgi:thioester reductase-like protein
MLPRPMGLVFVTGFPGFLGARLVARLLADDGDLRVAALVEPKMAERAREVAGRIDGGERVEVMEGDIAERDLGLGEDQLERLRAETTAAYHLAAIYNLAVPLEIAQKVNVDGTGNVLGLCSRCEKLERLNYVSTAYVAGTRTGHVYEHELVLGQKFKNHYESTKFQAEVWVRALMDRIPTTIYRPAIVVGDSRTGETQKFDGPYYLLRTVSVAAGRRMPIPQFGRAEAPFNVVPVDFVIDALAVADDDPELVGETLHLVDPEPVTSGELFRLLAREYAGKDPSYKLPPKAVEASLRSKTIRRAFSGAPPESIEYLNHAVRFDTRRADELLARHGLRCPRFEDYVGPIVEFFREHEDDEAYMPV